jgi:hypothetical protein
MASLKELRARISSVKATRKITKAMQMVAAAKLRRAQEQAIAARPYAERLEKIMSHAGHAASAAASLPLLRGTGSDRTQLLIVATGERGLAGAFNSNIARLARDHARKLQVEGKTVKIFTIGRKGRQPGATSAEPDRSRRPRACASYLRSRTRHCQRITALTMASSISDAVLFAVREHHRSGRVCSRSSSAGSRGEPQAGRS